jgi:hypothetical protein
MKIKRVSALRDAWGESKSFDSDFFRSNPTSGTVSKKRYLKRGSNHQFLSSSSKPRDCAIAGTVEPPHGSA